METLASVLQTRVQQKAQNNKVWPLAEKIANLLADPTDSKEKRLASARRWLRTVKTKQWEIEHAFVDLAEKGGAARNKAAYWLYSYKEWCNRAKQQKEAAS